MLPAPTACAVVAIMSSRDVKIASRPRLGLVAAEGARPAAVAIREAVDARAAIDEMQAYCGWIEKYGWWIRPNRTVGGLYVGGLYCRWIESSAGWIEAMSARRIEKCWASGLRSVGPVD